MNENPSSNSREVYFAKTLQKKTIFPFRFSLPIYIDVQYDDTNLLLFVLGLWRGIGSMEFIKKIYDWLEAIRLDHHKEISIAKYSGHSEINLFQPSPEKPNPNDWIQVFREISPISSVTYLEVNCKDANWNKEVLELSNRVFPNLQKLHLLVKAKKDFSIALNFPNIKELIINVMQKPNEAELFFEGNLPSLETVTLQHSGKIRIDSISFANLLANSKRLKNVHLYCKDSWLIAEIISESFFKSSFREKPTLYVSRSIQETSLWSYKTRTEEEKSREWNSLQKCWMLFANIDFTTILTACTDKEKFLLATRFIPKDVQELELSGDIHSYLLLEPELLKFFSKVNTLKIIHAGSLTTNHFQKICEILPSLTRCIFYNNHNPEFRTLRLKSNTLQELHLTHFHCLENFEIHSESLEFLELDNCSDDSFAKYPEIEGKWCNGFFGEKFISALLDGDSSIYAPNLNYLHIWHNQNGMGPPLVYENQRIDIECKIGHPRLEELHLSRLSHIRRLTLRNLPNLKSLSINDDFEEEEGWIEFLDLSDISRNCKVFIDGSLGSTKVSKYNWGHSNE